MDPQYIVCDTETTGFDPATCGLLEVAACGPGFGWWHYCEWEGEIPADARATHHIGPDDVRPGSYNCLPREATVAKLVGDALGRVPVFHNAAFDLGFLPELAGPTICTYRCAMHLWPDAPNYKNQTLRYWLEVDPNPDYLYGLSPHRGLYDAAVTEAILKEMLTAQSLEKLVDLTQRPILQETIRFGKHKGEKWVDVPRDYIRWMLRSGNWKDDVDIMYTIETVLG